MRAMQNPGIFPFYTYGTNVKLRTFKNTHFQNFVFSKITYFQNYALSKNTYFQNFVFSKIRTFKILYFQKYVLLKIRTFCRIPCFFQNFRVFKNFPFQSSSRIPQKNSVFFQKFPFRKKS